MAAFAKVQKDRAEALVRRWIADPLVQVLSSGPAMLGRQHALDVPDPAFPGRLGRRSAANVLVVERQDARGKDVSVWVAAGYRSYRAAYAAFIRSVYGFDPGPALSAFDVDHLLNKARAPAPTDFVRIEAIDASINRQWGAVFEASASTLPKRRSNRTMDYLVCAKLAGLPPPQSASDTAGIARIANCLRGLGHRDTPGLGTIEDEIRQLLGFYNRAAAARTGP